jgi:predicted dehydrogenase
MSNIGIGLIGTGFMGKCHALAFKAVAAAMGDMPSPRLEVIADMDFPRAQALAKTTGFARATQTWRELLADPAVDLIAITTPNGLHREMAIAALEAGKHVYCEKPMALTLADAEAMAAAARGAQGQTRLGYNYTCNPLIGLSAKLIGEGRLGDIVHVRALYDEDYMANADLPWSWRCERSAAGLGALGDLGCHAFSILHMLVGPVAAVVADMKAAHPQRPIANQPGEFGLVDNEDVASALLRFENGVSGIFTTSRAANGFKNGIRIEIHGTRGTLIFDQERMNEISLFIAEGEEATRGFRRILAGPLHPPFDRFCPAPGHGLGFNDLKTIEVATFLRAIADGTTVAFDFEAGLRIERVIHGISRSAGTGQWENVTAA